MQKNQSKDMALAIGNLIGDKKGKNIRLLNIGKQSDLADYFVIATVESDPQAQAVANHITEKMKSDFDEVPHHREGKFKESSWIILDYFQVVVHIFKPDERQKYNLEKLWVDAEITEIGEQEAEVDNRY